MREFTEKEKAIITSLIKQYHPENITKIADVLMELYPIKCIQKYVPDQSTLQLSEEYQPAISLQYKRNPQKDFSIDFYEAIFLICLLKDQHYLILDYIPIFDQGIIGSFSNEMELITPETKEFSTIMNFFDVFPHKIWPLLNSTFIVTNALIDYAKDFKTVEQRNFEKQLNDANKKHNEQMNEARKSLRTSKRSFWIATITLFLSTIFDISSCCSDTKRNDIHNTVIEQGIPRAISTNIANDTLKTIVIDKTKPMT